MKRIILIFQVLVIIYISITFANNESIKSNEISIAKEYIDYDNFNLMKIPDNYFYKLSSNSRYYLFDKNDILDIHQYDYGGLIIYYNTNILDLRYEYTDSFFTSTDTNVYIIKNGDQFYLFFDKMGGDNDYRCYQFYSLTNSEIKLLETGNGKINFVGYDYIIGCRDLGIIGYQRCEFKKVFKNGKIELDGEYKIINRDNLMQFPNWKFYELTNDLQYDIYIKDNNKYEKSVAKKGERVRALSTDAKTYILIETEKGSIGKVKVDKVDEENDYNFIVNGKLFMDYYFTDGTKWGSDVYAAMPDF